MRGWLGRGVFRPNRSEPKVKLDTTPSGEEEAQAFPYPIAAKGIVYPEGLAKTRIDRLARTLASVWTIFLMYIVIAQGNRDGVDLSLPWSTRSIRVVPNFDLEASEFIALVTTTTAAVFGFLVIIARYLFKAKPEAEPVGPAAPTAQPAMQASGPPAIPKA